MKALSENQIGYSGDVVITLRNKKRKVNRVFRLHNEGTVYLFNAIAKALAGYSIANELPGYIDIQTGNDSLLNNRLRITGRVYGSSALAGLSNADKSNYEGKGVVLVNAILTSGSKKTVSGDDCVLVLFNETNEQELARLEDARIAEMYNSVDDNNDALIEWRLVISDAPAQMNQQGE